MYTQYDLNCGVSSLSSRIYTQCDFNWGESFFLLESTLSITFIVEYVLLLLLSTPCMSGIGDYLLCLHPLVASVVQWLVLSLSERKVVGSNPPMVVHTPCRSLRLVKTTWPMHVKFILTIYLLPTSVNSCE